MHTHREIQEVTHRCGCGCGVITEVWAHYPGKFCGPPESCYESFDDWLETDPCPACGNDDHTRTEAPATCPALVRHDGKVMVCGAAVEEDCWFCAAHPEGTR